MKYFVAFIIIEVFISATFCSEQNVCTKYSRKSEMKYKKHVSRHGFGNHQTTYIVWYPVQNHFTVKSKVCCEGYSGHVEGKGCLTRSPCSVSLHHHTTAYCKEKRDLSLHHKRLYYVLNKPKDINDPSRVPTDLLIPVLNQSADFVRVHTMFDSSEAEWFNTYYLALGKGVRTIYAEAIKTFGIQLFGSPAQFLQLRHFYDSAIKAMNFPKIFYPSDLFLDVETNEEYLQDRVFAAKRLAGLNPIGLKRVVNDDDEAQSGTKWNELSKQLNARFNWAEAVYSVTGMGIHASANEGRLYVFDSHLVRDIPHMLDITDRNHNDSRVLRNETAPIALFGMKDVNGERVLYPIAIQIDYKPDSKVYKPSDNEAWKIAKLQFETIDSLITQLSNHLAKTHLVMERICVTAYRHFSKYHPLGQLLHPHCLGTIPVNSNGIPTLLQEKRVTHMQWGVGNIGATEVLNRAFVQQHWDDYDLPKAIKLRGMDDVDETPYYPYRDDGMVIYDLIKQYSHDYVDLHYKSEVDIMLDTRLQAFANEVSLQGTIGTFAAIGKLNGFPAKFQRREELKETLTRTLFMIADHSAYNFPLAEFMNFIPSTPSKLYMDKSKNLTAFESLGDSGLAAMNDEKSRRLVELYHAELHEIVAPVIERRIKNRLAKGEFGYPYFLPRLIPNSIST